jgi:hypothetical protein
LHKLAADRDQVKRGGISTNVGVQVELLLKSETATESIKQAAM